MLERILKFAVYRRYLVLLATLVVGGVGAYALSRLPIDAVPDITNNQVQINTEAPSLSPTEIEKQVTFAIETALAGIPGLKYTRSLSRNGFSQVTAVFDDSVDIYFARQQIGERLSEARETLPSQVEPKMGAIATGLGEVFAWSVEYAPKEEGQESRQGKRGSGWQADGSFLTPEGEHLSGELALGAYLRTVQDWIIRPQMKGLAGLAGVDAIGGYVKQYHVSPDPLKLVSYGLSFQDLIEALENNNVSTGAGYIEHEGEAYLVRADARINNEHDIGQVPLKAGGGVRLTIADVAEIGLGREARTGSASKSGSEVVIGTAIMRIGENSRVVAAAVAGKLKEIGKSLPPVIRAVPVLDRTKLVDATIRTVESNLVEGAILVIAVLFALLGNFRAAVITAMAIPLSMLMLAAGMVKGGLSGNLMSLGAVDFGLIVDGAVIIVENCLRRLAIRGHELGRAPTLEERLEEVIAASKEMIQPSVFGQAIIITTYLPILALTGVEGKMFHPMALTVIIALVSAFVLSLTFVPAMLAIFVRGKVSEHEGAIIRKAKGGYRRALGLTLRRPLWFIGGAVFLLVVGVACFTRLGQEFVPRLDEQDLAIETRRLLSTGITLSTKMQLEIERRLSALPEVSYVFSKLGTAEMASDPAPPSGADTYVMFKPRAEWPDPKARKEDVVTRVIETLSELPGTSFELSQPIEMRFNELIAGVRSDVAIKVFGDDFDSMQATAKDITKALEKIRGIADLKTEQTSGFPTLNIAFDREALARYGLSAAQAVDVVGTAVGGKTAGLVFEGDRRFEVKVRLGDEARQNLSTLANLPIPLGGGAGESTAGRDDSAADGPSVVPLTAVAKLQLTEGPNQVSRENGKRRVVVQANVRGRDLGSFVAEAQAKVDSTVKLRAGQWVEWGGQFENLVAARERLLLVVPACFLLIFMILYSAFNSPKYAAIVFSGVPLALTGGVVSLLLRGMPFSVTAAVGFIALSGVAVLNGLVMVSFINQLRRDGMQLEEALLEGSLARLRPVLMTALVASLGFVPMALATGTGAEVQRPLATVVIGGLISSTALTLLVLPALYLLCERKRKKHVAAPRTAEPSEGAQEALESA